MKITQSYASILEIYREPWPRCPSGYATYCNVLYIIKVLLDVVSARTRHQQWAKSIQQHCCHCGKVPPNFHFRVKKEILIVLSWKWSAQKHRWKFSSSCKRSNPVTFLVPITSSSLLPSRELLHLLPWSFQQVFDEKTCWVVLPIILSNLGK